MSQNEYFNTEMILLIILISNLGVISTSFLHVSDGYSLWNGVRFSVDLMIYVVMCIILGYKGIKKIREKKNVSE